MDNMTIYLLLAFILGYFADSIIKQMCGGRLVEGLVDRCNPKPMCNEDSRGMSGKPCPNGEEDCKKYMKPYHSAYKLAKCNLYQNCPNGGPQCNEINRENCNEDYTSCKCPTQALLHRERDNHERHKHKQHHKRHHRNHRH